MRAHALLSILSLFRNLFHYFKNTGAQMLDSIYPVTYIRVTGNSIFQPARYAGVCAM